MHNMCYICICLKYNKKSSCAHTPGHKYVCTLIYVYILSWPTCECVGWRDVVCLYGYQFPIRDRITTHNYQKQSPLGLVEGYQSAAGTLLSVIPCYICIYLRTYMYTLEGWPCPLLTIVTGIGCKTLSTL